MRKNWLIALLGAVVMAAVPAVALAHGTSRNHHAKRHARVRLRHFTAADSGSTGTTSGSPTTPGSNDAGKVASFDASTGKLVITLNDGSTVSGTVTGDTELQCESAASSSSQSGSMQSDDQTSGSDGGPSSGSDDTSTAGQDDQGDQTEQADTSDQGDQTEQADTNDQAGENDQGDDDGNQQSCSTSNLTTGTTVHAAELAISSTGAVWRGVDLVLS